MVVAALRMHRQPQRDKAWNARIAAAGLKPYIRSKGKADEEDGQVELAIKPVKGRARVVLLAPPVIMRAFAQPGTTKVEAQDGQSVAVEGLHRVVDDLVMNRPAAQRVRVTGQHRVRRVGAARVEECFKASVRADQIVDAAQDRSV